MKLIQWGIVLIAGVTLAACSGGGHGGGGGAGSSTGTVGGSSNGPLTVSSTYTVSGSISGLTASGLVLLDNGGNALDVAADATSFQFSTVLASGSAYAVTVQTQPLGETCSVSNGGGAISGANITNVSVTCSAETFTVGGSITGLAASGLVLLDNGGNAIDVASNMTFFQFSAPVANGGGYAVTVQTQPSGETCSVSNGSGTISGADVTNVSVTCATEIFTVSGSISGLTASGLVLLDNGGNALSVASSATSFQFSTAVANGSAYAVTVQTQPSGETCSVSNGSGTISGADVTNVSVTCATEIFTVGGSISGLTASGLVLLDNGGNALNVASSATSFQFGTAVANGSAYAVTVQTQPSGETCSVSNGGGTVSGANVTNISVSCTTNLYSIGGSTGGLTGAGLVLQDNGGDDLSVSSNGNFIFATSLANGSAYAVTVATQPAGETCTVANGGGTISGGDVTNVSVTCSDETFTVGGSITGLTASGLVLLDNGGNALNVASSATSFQFSTALANGSAYAVTVQTQPSGETCSVSNGGGTVSGANVTNISVSCTINLYSIAGSTSGLTGTGLVLQDNGGDNLNVSSNGNFTFGTRLTTGQPYGVTVMTQPSSTPAQYCTVSNGSGTVGAENVANVAITCRNTGQYIYVTTSYPGSGLVGVVSLFAIDPTTGLLDRESRFDTGDPQPLGIVLDTSGYGYVAYQDSTPVETIVAGGAVPISEFSKVHNGANTSTFVLALDPNPAAPYMFAGGSSSAQQGCTLSGSGLLFNYSVSAGVLTSLSSGPYPLDGSPCGIVIDPTGKLLLVTIPTASEIVAYSVSAADGSVSGLNNNTPYTFQGGVGVNTPYGVAIHPTSGYLFVTDSTANTVTAYSYSASTGAISEVGSPYPVGSTPESVTIDPTGQFLYVANSGNGTVSAFTINAATGALTAISGSPFDTYQGPSTTPTAVAVEPSGQYVYVANGDAATVSIFSINPSTGALSPVGATPACPNGPTCSVGGYGGTGASAMAIQ